MASLFTSSALSKLVLDDALDLDGHLSGLLVCCVHALAAVILEEV